jgi:uncharacterized membrane protein
MTRLTLPLAVLLAVAACDDVGPIATLGATRLAWEAVAEGPGWAAKIDDPELTLTLDGRRETVAVTYRDTSQGRVFSGAFSGGPLSLLLAPGPCAPGLDGTPRGYEFTARLTVGDTIRSGCGSRPWTIGYKRPA